MASKEKLKKHSRNIYLKDAGLWGRLQAVAEEKHWSLNQVIEITLSGIYPKPK